ncbi:Chemotaxis protein methyltransferase [Tritonibacter multivorans]|uniref:protein-glutamate O-methyltransferase n=1 Tax=Tritonibacter multivorans TaxID=928856 RepID=A0A0P1GEY1_9RHOB|nr:protein-glutamate O-methyltransferase CheR [Tritonibacter multivorans]MDA7421095.1 protein-glutamate O-methyltransferase CheR [Tritonibacter multivorans]CUH80183.1 Chemotaxis protein methyltransferase [Tritonibacter multivorans]SFC75405.1 MCP methyltransferase, CheR-type [Tritonibacter multivorans]
MPEKEIELQTSSFNKLRALIHQKTGITVADNRRGLLQSRLRGRLRETQEDSFTSYLDRVAKDANELQELIDRITTNETYCYRTPRIWDFFRDTFLPEFCDKKLPRPMRAWSAASSTGEEAHTIGIFCEDQRQTSSGFDYEVFGTDISSRVVRKAQEGRYVGKAIARLQREQPTLFERHMTGDKDAGFAVKPEIKSRLTFKLHNLIKPLGPSQKFDIVFLRNVLIYFSAEEQERILRNVARQMQPDAYLIIGESESLTRLDTAFQQVSPLIYSLETG